MEFLLTARTFAGRKKRASAGWLNKDQNVQVSDTKEVNRNTEAGPQILNLKFEILNTNGWSVKRSTQPH
jgi:hypothetical protein